MAHGSVPWAASGRGVDDGTFGSLVARTVEEEVRAVASTSGGEDGSVGVLVPAALMDEVRGALERGGVTAGEAGAGALTSRSACWPSSTPKASSLIR